MDFYDKTGFEFYKKEGEYLLMNFNNRGKRNRFDFQKDHYYTILEQCKPQRMNGVGVWRREQR